MVSQKGGHGRCCDLT